MKKTITILLSILLLACVFGCATEAPASEPEATQPVAAAEPTEAPAANKTSEESEEAETEPSRLDIINYSLTRAVFRW